MEEEKRRLAEKRRKLEEKQQRIETERKAKEERIHKEEKAKRIAEPVRKQRKTEIEPNVAEKIAPSSEAKNISSNGTTVLRKLSVSLVIGAYIVLVFCLIGVQSIIVSGQIFLSLMGIVVAFFAKKLKTDYFWGWVYQRPVLLCFASLLLNFIIGVNLKRKFQFLWLPLFMLDF
jgi:hypothetical protein